MTYYDYLCRLLEPMRVYRTERGTLSGGELYAAGKALDKADGATEYAEREGLLQTAEGEGLARREKLFSRCPVSVSTALRREAIAALARINADSFTLDAINSTLSGCGIKALAEETEGTAQTPPAVEGAADPANGEAKQENQPAEQEEQQEDSATKQDEAVADVQAHHVGMAAVLAHDRIDVLPGEELVVRGKLHVVEDLKSAARESGVLFGHQRQQIQH